MGGSPLTRNRLSPYPSRVCAIVRGVNHAKTMVFRGLRRALSCLGSLGSGAYGEVRGYLKIVGLACLVALPPVALAYVAYVLHDRRRHNPYDEIFHESFEVA